MLDDKLNFGEHLKHITNKVKISIGLLHKLKMIFSGLSLVTTNESFIRPYLHDGDVNFDQSFHDYSQSIQYNASLATRGGIWGIWKEKLYQNLGLASL